MTYQRRTIRNSRREGMLAAPAMALALGLLLATSLSASAHATLLRADPAIGGSFAESPAAITLWFSEPVELRYSRVQVLQSDGRAVVTGELQRPPDIPDPALRLPLPEALPDGSYTVVWSTLSTVDGHVAQGFFSFAVGPAVLPSAAEEQALARQAADADSVPLAVEAAVRWLGLLGQALLSGMLVFVVAILAPAMRLPAGRMALPAVRPRRLLWGGLLAVAIAHLAAALIQVMRATNAGPSDAFGRPLVTLLSDTRFGALWLARGVLVVALGLLIWSLTRGERIVMPRRAGTALWSWVAALATSGLLLLTTSLGSHAAALGGRLRLTIVNDWLHLVATSIWLGGLLALATLASPARRALAERDSGLAPSLTVRMLARFSALALGAVAVLLVTGLIAARSEVVGWDGIVSTRYGTWFTLKLTLVAAALGFGAWHLLVTRPRMAAGSIAGTERAFARTLRAEALFGVLALLAAAVLTSSVPARELLDRGVSIFGATRLIPQASVTLRASPGRIGNNDFSVVVAPIDPVSFGGVDRVYLRFALTGEGAPGGSQRVLLRQAGDPSTFAGTGAYLALDGDWTVTAIIRRAGERDIEVPFAITATGAGLYPTGVSPPPGGGLSRRVALLGTLWLLVGLSLAIASYRWRAQSRPLAAALSVTAVLSTLAAALILALGSR